MLEISKTRDNVVNLKHQVYILAVFGATWPRQNVLDLEAVADFLYAL